MSKNLTSIIANCRKGNRRAQFDLYQHCFDQLMLTCNRYKKHREDALALLNQGFLKVLNHLDKYDDSRDFLPWASTIMVRTAIDEYRSTRQYNSETVFVETDTDLEDLATTDQHHMGIVENLDAKEIKEMIFALPENERIVFTLYELEGYKHAEIAVELGVTERTTKRYLKSAKVMLKKRLEYFGNAKSLSS